MPVLPAGRGSGAIKCNFRLVESSLPLRHLKLFSRSRNPSKLKETKMASNYVDAAEEIKFDHHHNQHHHHHHHHHAQGSSPRAFRRTLSSNSSACGDGAAAAAAAPPKCVCAPATHAGSFKCRLHRAASHHSPPSPVAAAAPSIRPPPPAVSSSANRTVEAQ
uniref:Uncharacterized protein n=1 Tax=Ananas comosus var. bracteatus TaxID=296719 RepID=A0A6V7Q119_ANACO|nr:unnamed protein product [Ananas comosus var. bracteatus]